MHQVTTQLRVAVVHADCSHGRGLRSAEASLAEAVGLTEALHYLVVAQLIFPLRQIHNSTFVGKGKLEEIAQLVEQKEVDVVIVNHALSPLQQRNLEQTLDCRVMDRYTLILEIFAAHAYTHEGRLQVELATLNYQRSRLQRSWEHLERQRGGFGVMGGPGERQIEIDRRLIDDRIQKIKKQLVEVTRTRQLHRQARQRFPYPLVALVGYTNAGKSTLFNHLTHAQVEAKDLLFTTLDPTMRLLRLPSGAPLILSDTVGFIGDLPTSLIAAFRATLEEVVSATILLHVRDISHAESEAQKADVEAVLQSLQLPPSTPVIEVWNKCDLLPQWPTAGAGIPISARLGQGSIPLLQRIEATLTESKQQCRYRLRSEDGAALAWLYRHAQVEQRFEDAQGLELVCQLSQSERARFESRFPLTLLE